MFTPTDIDAAWARVAQGNARGEVRHVPEDFVVDELPLRVAACASGAYVHLRLRKRNLTTAWVMAGLARHFDVPTRDVGHAGLKDRRAVTTQHFSVRSQAAVPLQPWFEPGTQMQLLHRADAPLRPGDLAGNRFRLRIRAPSDRRAIEHWLLQLLAQPQVPNYFGPQRFGNGAANLQAVTDWAVGRRQPQTRFERGMWLSSARAWLFNLALSERVTAGDWSRAASGDARIHGAAAGPLWGRGKPLPAGSALARCRATWTSATQACALLEREGVRQDLRPWAMPVAALAWRWHETDLLLDFVLPAGCFATALLRELLPGNRVELVPVDAAA